MRHMSEAELNLLGSEDTQAASVNTTVQDGHVSDSGWSVLRLVQVYSNQTCNMTNVSKQPHYSVGQVTGNR